MYCLEDSTILTKSFIGTLHVLIKLHILLTPFTRSHRTLCTHLTDNIMLLDTLFMHYLLLHLEPLVHTHAHKHITYEPLFCRVHLGMGPGECRMTFSSATLVDPQYAACKTTHMLQMSERVTTQQHLMPMFLY